MSIIGYAYDASIHCDPCAAARFGRCTCDHKDVHGQDREGNEVEPIFSTDELAGELTCDDCGDYLL